MTVDTALEKMLTEYPDVLDARQISEILSIEPHNVRKKIKSGDIPGFVIGSRYRAAKACIIEYIIGTEKG